MKEAWGSPPSPLPSEARLPPIAWADRQRLERFAPLAAAFPLSPTAAPAGPPPLAPADHLEPGPSPERCHYCAARKGPQVAGGLLPAAVRAPCRAPMCTPCDA